MKCLGKFCLTIAIASFTSMSASAQQAKQTKTSNQTFKVIILAGQSNMEGKAQNKLLDFQASDKKTAHLYKHLRKNDQWIVRDDVFIKYLKRHGGLTIGYGSKNRTGMELEFGTVIGNQSKQPVLLIKTAWGGHSLYRKFRSPSAGLPDETFLKNELEKATARTKRLNEKHKRNQKAPTMEEIKSVYGSSYRTMLAEINGTLANYETLFPALKGMQPELYGFVWFQGWNDQYNGAEKHYAQNMKHFINDVRKDLNTPTLPIVIAVMGQNGSKPAKGPMKNIQEAQLSMEKLPEFINNVKAVRTDVLIDKKAEALFPKWRDNITEWEKVGSDRGYHYLGSAIWFSRIGKSCAEALIKLEPK